MRLLRFTRNDGILPFLFLLCFHTLLYSEEPSKTETTKEAPAENVYLEVILDASGSMWEQIDGQFKSEIAKQTLTKILPKIDEKTHLSFRAYGHRKKKDCKDSHLEYLFTKGNREGLTEKIQSIQALSMTPIGYSLEEAGKDLKPQQGARNILLISDGKESCNTDPCDIAKQLYKDIQVKINVIGFDIKDKAAHEELSCIAKATGGTYVIAKNADDLFKATEGLTKPIQWNFKVNTPADLTYTFTAIDEKTGSVVLEKKSAYYRYELPEGTYTIKVDTKPEYVEKNVKIQKGKEMTVTVKKMGELKVDTVLDFDFVVSVTNQANNTKLLEKVTVYYRYDVPAGKYSIEVVHKERPNIFWTAQDVVVEEGKLTQLKMPGVGWLKVDTGSQGLTCTIKIFDQNKNVQVLSGYTMGAFLLPKGIYRATIENERTKKNYELQNLQVQEWQKTTRELNCKE